MTVRVVIPAEAGIQRNSGCTLPTTHHLPLTSHLFPTLDWFYLTHHSLHSSLKAIDNLLSDGARNLWKGDDLFHLGPREPLQRSKALN